MKYVNSFLKRNCAEELVTLFGHTNNPAKEITESWGALHHMTNAIAKDGKRKRLGCFVELNLAIKARQEAEETYHGKFTYHNSRGGTTCVV